MWYIPEEISMVELLKKVEDILNKHAEQAAGADPPPMKLHK